METEGDHGNSTGPAPAFNPILASNTAEYMLFVLDDDLGGARARAPKPIVRLEQLRKAALQLSENLTRDYIWQKDAFNLEVVSRNGLLYLHGTTDYGDSVEDEWLIVYMLRELSRSFAGVWARICDSDGEFLLVEAASAVPKWLSPEIDANRVWIHDGKLKIISPIDEKYSRTKSPSAFGPTASLSLGAAVETIASAPGSLLHLPALEAEAFYRLGKYPGHVAASIHWSRVVIPRKVAYILHDRPRAIAPAAEAFYLRDPLSVKRTFESVGSRPFKFPPGDLVTVSVKFTKVLYAQLRSQKFTPPEMWSREFVVYAAAATQVAAEEKRSSETGGTAYEMKIETMVNLGMKITFGFELMAATVETSNNRTVREIGLVLEDLEEDNEVAHGLPTDEEIQAWKNVDRDDDDSWLNINFQDLEQELDKGRQDGRGSSLPKSQDGGEDTGLESGFGDAGVQTDLQKLVSRFQDFLNDNQAGIDGAEFDEMDNDDDDDDDDDDSDTEGNEVSFDEEGFSCLMREMMGLPPSDTLATKAPTAGSAISSSASALARTGSEEPRAVPTVDVAADENSDISEEEVILRLAAQFEAELKGHGALALDPPANGKQVAAPTKRLTASGTAGESSRTVKVGESDDEAEVDVDFNLAKNLLESFKGQAGMPGPAGNLLSMLGLSLPRDEDDDSEEEGPGSKEQHKS